MRYLTFFFTLCALILALIVPVHATSMEDPPVTVYDESGNVIYTNETETQAEFLYKPFEDYTVMEGFLLLFLILGFCCILWVIVRGVF